MTDQSPRLRAAFRYMLFGSENQFALFLFKLPAVTSLIIIWVSSISLRLFPKQLRHQNLPPLQSSSILLLTLSTLHN